MYDRVHCESVGGHMTGYIVHSWRPIVFNRPGVQDMSIVICACKVSVELY